MHVYDPTVHILAATEIDRAGMGTFLHAIGEADFTTDAVTGAEELIEVAGRLCYLSFSTKTNKNLTRVREGNLPYISNVIASKHGSILEHGTVTFAVPYCTPVFTHELVRHRVGTAFSQISGRYVRVDQIEWFNPEVFSDAMREGLISPQELAQVEHEIGVLIGKMEHMQNRLAVLFKLNDIKDFFIKKRLTSAFRRLLPYGLRTGIIFTMNHRAIRHLIALRTSTHAEEEIRRITFDIGAMMKARFPAIYADMTIVEEETPLGMEYVWKFEHEKV